MGSIRTTIATMLAALALAAIAPDTDAQTRRSSDVSRSASDRQSAARSSSRAGRSSQATKSDDNNKSSVSRPANTAATPSKKGATPTIIPGIKPGSNDKDDSKPGLKPGSDKPVQITRPVPRRPQGNSQTVRPGVRPDARPDKPNKPYVKPGKPSYWWSYDDHYYGHKVRMLPSRARRHVYHGVTYYCHNDIWYRPDGGHYVVCRPPYGLSVAAEIISGLAWTAVRMSYYNAMSDAYGRSAYALADKLELKQSHAVQDSEYFYQDGVFYAKDARGEYRIILPPAGALVESLPEDFCKVTLDDGKEYYKVDETIYRFTIIDGKPYFEVVGQLYR